MSEAVSGLEKGKSKESVGEFVRKTREEMTRVSFPSSDDVKKTTMIVIINVLFFAVFLFLIDRFWIYFLEAITWVVNRIAGI
ncbi:MAG: preprotein translocase subunit SecE [Blastocatellia bacterium]|nr:preprotein translocase subunit SecE [Chloracidobacterium sp.]MBL8185299.1 preprotein translocase subunit SecE [Blastocatellia bacterium]HRJ89939.1 preprotein translocase subunit SecE [Pyrinomonadaceae bacterium]HRK51296.1 preprotein translocase subunit SecE [Pyrinomonadaceae bacterium]